MDKENIKRRIKSLLQMTKDRGCTEAEALSAATKAAELMREYGLNYTDIEMTEESIEVDVGIRSMRSRLWGVISACTNTAILIQNGNNIKFYGRDPWPEVATYLLKVCNQAVTYEIANFKKTESYKRRRTTATKKRAVADFTYGLVERLELKLFKLFEKTFSKELVLEAKQYIAKTHTNTKTVAHRDHKIRFDDASSQGWVAGGKVNVSHGVNSGKNAPQIGGK